jgi:hypothetical protein
MPQAPMLPPQMAQQQAADPMNFLLAAADLHNQGQLSDQTPTSVVPKGKSLPAFSKGQRRPKGTMKILK